MLEPELVVGVEEVVALVAVIAMHAVWVDHEVKLLTLFMHHIKKLKGVLMMYIVVAGAVSELEHHRFDRLPRR